MSLFGAPLVVSICSECGGTVEFELGTLQVRCGHCEAGMAVDQGLRPVRLSCPRCGGNFYYVDGSLCSRCPYCEAALLVLGRERLLSYVILPAAPPGAPDALLYLLPFWHLSGLVYGFDVGSKQELLREPSSFGQDPSYQDIGLAPRAVVNDSGPQKIFRGRVVDLSLPDPATAALGITSLRSRRAVFPLEPLTAEHEQRGRLVPATLDLERAREALRERAKNPARPSDGLTRLAWQRQDLAAECLSLLYYPFWVEEIDGAVRAIWDGVNGQPEPLATPTPPPGYGSSPVFDDLHIVELSCNTCGNNLSTGNHAVVLPCSHCGEFWLVTRDGLRSFCASYATPWQKTSSIVWLPFWHLPVTIHYMGREARDVAALRSILGVLTPKNELPRAAPTDPLSYYAPAFGALKAPRMDFAARDMTRLQPKLEPGPRGEGETYSCFFSAEDAERLAYVTWIPILPGTVVQRLQTLRIQTSPASLWYVPFEDRGRELVNLLTGIRYDRSVFRGVRH